ncbi:hypothetical protein CBR_g53619 [Chara braunii]|uniref:Tyrosine-protein phosphatase domain-containing protein n=1 Tax=Chara braunii TaxID=69332 RepID=A0A388MB22_CHABU|nr:hypothetical protein CBR_g53619 [Chara braunii]|eukprot:GBG91766.1 hypothetical protein CBR_g53619 [Chara braunii]
MKPCPKGYKKPANVPALNMDLLSGGSPSQRCGTLSPTLSTVESILEQLEGGNDEKPVMGVPICEGQVVEGKPGEQEQGMDVPMAGEEGQLLEGNKEKQLVVMEVQLSESQLLWCRRACQAMEEKWRSKDKNKDFFEEYKALKEETEYEEPHAAARKCLVGGLAVNVSKNRYSNIVPFDRTRVELVMDEDSKVVSDYINASYIRGDWSESTELLQSVGGGGGGGGGGEGGEEGRVKGGGDRGGFSDKRKRQGNGGVDVKRESYCSTISLPTYIATQAPLPWTILDFWTKVKQLGCRAVIMLMEDLECKPGEAYFPDEEGESCSFGRVVIKTMSKTFLHPAITRRDILIIPSPSSPPCPPPPPPRSPRGPPGDSSRSPSHSSALSHPSPSPPSGPLCTPPPPPPFLSRSKPCPFPSSRGQPPPSPSPPSPAEPSPSTSPHSRHQPAPSTSPHSRHQPSPPSLPPPPRPAGTALQDERRPQTPQQRHDQEQEEEQEPLLVEHYHLHDWPDQGVPSSTRSIRLLLRQIRTSAVSNGPFGVHCVAGSGRTGVFCAVDRALRKVLSGDLSAINMREEARWLRQQRPGMIQTMEQYFFCYKVLWDALAELSATAAGRDQTVRRPVPFAV